MQPVLRASAPPDRASSFPDGGVVASLLLGAALLVAGAWFLHGGRARASEIRQDQDNPPGRLTKWRNGLSVPTCLSFALAALVSGYHAIAWGGPRGWLSICIPIDLWWIPAIGVVCLVFGSLAADRFE